jgi:hypothetical protein
MTAPALLHSPDSVNETPVESACMLVYDLAGKHQSIHRQPASLLGFQGVCARMISFSPVYIPPPPLRVCAPVHSSANRIDV